MEDSRVKIVFVGDSQVGKTSIFAILTSRGFPQQNSPTIGAGHETFEFSNGTDSFLGNLWDTAGQEVYRSLLPTYLRNANYCILTFDVTNQKSFFDLNEWVEFLRENAPKDIRILLVGNKMDMENMITVTMQDATNYADTIGAIGYIATSAKTHMGIHDLIVALVEDHKANPVFSKPKGPVEADKKGCC